VQAWNTQTLHVVDAYWGANLGNVQESCYASGP